MPKRLRNATSPAIGLILTIGLLLSSLAPAKCPLHGDDCLVCVPKREAVKEERHCWCVERKNVSVPPVFCPWEPGGSPINTFDWVERLLGHGKSCRPAKAACGCPTGCQGVRCGEVRQVCDLVKKTYEVKECQWKWEVRRLPPCRCRYCGSGDVDASGGFGCECDVGGRN